MCSNTHHKCSNDQDIYTVFIDEKGKDDRLYRFKFCQICGTKWDKQPIKEVKHD